MKNRFIKALSVIGMGVLLVVNVSVLAEDVAYEPSMGGDDGDSMTVTCYDNIESNNWWGNGFLKRECNLASRCAKIQCSRYEDPGSCTLRN